MRGKRGGFSQQHLTNLRKWGEREREGKGWGGFFDESIQ